MGRPSTYISDAVEARWQYNSWPKNLNIQQSLVNELKTKTGSTSEIESEELVILNLLKNTYTFTARRVKVPAVICPILSMQ